MSADEFFNVLPVLSSSGQEHNFYLFTKLMNAICKYSASVFHLFVISLLFSFLISSGEFFVLCIVERVSTLPDGLYICFLM